MTVPVIRLWHSFNVRSSCIYASSKIPLTIGAVNWIPITRTAETYSIAFCSQGSQSNTIMAQYLPHFASGEIVHGFGRGSRELGIPTANYPLEVVKALPEDFITGAYYGWCNVDGGEIYKMVMSVGWNPFYQNKEKSMETHILHEFPGDLYGSILKVCIVGYIRPERNFDSLESLIATIKDDIRLAHEFLDKPENQHFKDMDFFKELTPPDTSRQNGHT